MVLTGTAAASPTAPDITRNDNLYDLVLADVQIPAGAAYIATQHLMDKRLDTPCAARSIR